MDLLKKIGFESLSWTELGYVLAGLLSAVTLAAAAWAWWERQQHDPWLRLLDRARTRAGQAGVASDATTTPRQLAQRLAALHPGQPHIAEAAQWLLDLEAIRYAPTAAVTTAAPGAQAKLPNASASASTNANDNRLRTLTQRFTKLRWPSAEGNDAPPTLRATPK